MILRTNAIVCFIALPRLVLSWLPWQPATYTASYRQTQRNWLGAPKSAEREGVRVWAEKKRGVNTHRRSEKVPANQTHAQAEFDPNNPFFTVDYTARDEEEELMISLDGEDEFTETFSNVGERRKKAEESRNRHDFTSLSVEEIARGYQVPISWLGDALVNFGVTPPIQWNAKIGDMIGGEDAAAILEALHGWDHSVMYDMYTWDSVRDLASTHDLALSDILRVCDEEGFTLPFGLRSRLRWEHYARLMRRLNRADELSDDIRKQFKDPDYPDTTDPY